MLPDTDLASTRSTCTPDSLTSPLTEPASSARTLRPVAITVPLTVPSTSVVGAADVARGDVARHRLGQGQVRRAR